MMQEAEIIIKSNNKEEYEHLIKAGIDPLIAELLYNKGINTPEEAKFFLECNINDMHDPGKIRNIEKAYKLIERLDLQRKFIFWGL